MASVTSMGLHQPAGLRYAIDELNLPEDASHSSYSWDISIDTDTDDGEVEDELLVVENCVIWSRGSLFRKAFTFDIEKQPVMQALLAYFHTSNDYQTPASTIAPKKKAVNVLSKALVVFLRTQAHVHFLSGPSHVIHLPFEVESVCKAPIGVILQRKISAEHSVPVPLRFPKVPPNSFVSSQLSTFSDVNPHETPFSTEALGKPKALPFRLSSTLGHSWAPRMERNDSDWPRLMCLIDPLLDFGYVVVGSDKDKRNNLKAPRFLDPAEEILHIEEIHSPLLSLVSPSQARESSDLILAVTCNRDSCTYTLWRVDYIGSEDPIKRKGKNAKLAAARRKSSLKATLIDSPIYPHKNFQASFGSPLPRKRSRKSGKTTENPVDNPVDLVSSLEQDREANITRRASRRVSSMLARADLSASHDRTIFADQAHTSTHIGGKRLESYGSQRGRNSIGYSQLLHQSRNSLLEAPVDTILDELRTTGDLGSFHAMALDDHPFGGLKQELVFTKLQTIPLESSNVRFSLSEKPARDQSTVFFITSPALALDRNQAGQIVVGIQDPAEKRLVLLTLPVQWHLSPDSLTARSLATVGKGQIVRAQNVVDSCKVTDADTSMILILSEADSSSPVSVLSIQAPWNHYATIPLDLLRIDNIRSLQYTGRRQDRDVCQKRTEKVDFSRATLSGLRYAMRRGVVDILDKGGRLHQIRIQLQPNCSQTKKVLDACRCVLPPTYSEAFLAGWWQLMQWIDARDANLANVEWSCAVLLILASYLTLGDASDLGAQPRHLPSRTSRPPFSSLAQLRRSQDWLTMESFEAPNSSAYPQWMLSRGWKWAVTEDDEVIRHCAPSFIASHITLAKQYLMSPQGESAFGQQGYLPTAITSDEENRRKLASDMVLALHLLLEEQSLDIMTSELASPGRADLRALLCRITRWLRWPDYAEYEIGLQEDFVSEEDDISIPFPIPQPPFKPSVFDWIENHLVGNGMAKFPTLADVYHSTTANLPDASDFSNTRWEPFTPRIMMFKKLFRYMEGSSGAEAMVEAMFKSGITRKVLESLPEGILVPFQEAILQCQPQPPTTWSKDLLEFVNRRDIALLLSPGSRPRHNVSNILVPTHVASQDYRMVCQTVNELPHTEQGAGEGLDRQMVLRAMFKDDRRLQEAQDLLATHKPRSIRLDPQPSWTESQYLEKQRDLVTRIASSTLATPPGRALLYYGLRFPLLTQKFHVPGFMLSCSVKPMNVIIGVDKSLYSEDKVAWGFFHQGVAAGLAISPHAKGIDTSWILFNKPGQDLSNRHAGFLLALGLNGHLKQVAKWVAFKYLTPKHTMTSVGLLLGLAASYMGTMDSLITRMLSVHATRMLPRGSAELNLSPLMQTSAIMGIGLLYYNSQHRRMSEIMMSEIEHLVEEDEQEPLKSECYRLAAGFALGFINLAKGNDLKGLHDMRLTEKLISLATATKKVEIVHVLDRAASGAVIAIALIFMKSDDQTVARKIDVPDSVQQFDYIRPDILLLRTLAKNLILWSRMQPKFAWIETSVPAPFRTQYRLTEIHTLKSTDMPLFSIIAGACFSLALRYAGSRSSSTCALLVHFLDEFMRITRLPSVRSGSAVHCEPRPHVYDEELARNVARMCLDVLALSAAIVMAGTGDLTVLRRLRSLHGRDDAATTFGSHMAAHLAIGALFLGCGTATFGTSDLAIASLLLSFYPIFPVSVADNRSHLQAFRHFWVLATDPRCLVTKDVVTGLPVSVQATVRTRVDAADVEITSGVGGADQDPLSEKSNYRDLIMTTPCLLPPLSNISLISTKSGMTYWDTTLDLDANPALAASFRSNPQIFLRNRIPLPTPSSTVTQSLLRSIGSSHRPATNPLDWVFSLPALRDIAGPLERSQVLDIRAASMDIASVASCTAVDARLQFGEAIESVSRERLLGLRLLFSWADRRSSLFAKRGRSSDVERHESDQSWLAGVGLPPNPTDCHTAADPSLLESAHATDLWWISPGAVEDLKARVWLAGREEE